MSLMPSKVVALCMASASVASVPTLSAASWTEVVVWEMVSALCASTASSWASVPSAWLSMGERALAVPASLLPTPEKESSASDTCGIVEVARLDCRLARA